MATLSHPPAVSKPPKSAGLITGARDSTKSLLSPAGAL